MSSLDPYRRKRDFSRSPEPAGSGDDAGPAGALGDGGEPRPEAGGTEGDGPAAGRARRFVVQRHRARRLHYDLRFEIGDVLVSWAVPKGPTLDPAIRRLAVHVEDHPLEYADFEGVIPEGEYGGGDVIVWDRGTWEPHGTDDPAAAVAAGELHAELHGEKLVGRLVLIRRGRAGSGAGDRPAPGGKEQWLLFHKRDEHAVSGWDPEAFPRSVKSGRTNDEVAEGRDAVWLGEAPAAHAEVDLSAASDEDLPEFVPPMAAVPVLADRRGAVPAAVRPGPGSWRYELDWGGLRVQARVEQRRVELRDGSGRPVGDLFPELVGPPSWLRGERGLVDGVVVAVDGAGRPSYPLLGDERRRAGGSPDGSPLPIVYQVFDLLHLDGRDLRDVPLGSRARLAGSVVADHRRVRLAGSVEGDLADLLAAATEAGSSGILARRLDSRYEAGATSADWSALRLRPEEDFVICGWEPEGRRTGSGRDTGGRDTGDASDDGDRPRSLLVAARDGAGRLAYAGRVQDGLDEQARDVLAALLAHRATARSEVAGAPRARGVRWVRPELVARCRFAGRTPGGQLRAATLLGVEPVGDRAPGAAPSGRAAAGRAPANELVALDRLGDKGRWHVAGRQVTLTNLDKVLFPGRDGARSLTKRDLVRYYARIAPVMVPHLADRPVNMHRYPDGVDRAGFWHKELPAHAPAWLQRWRNDEADPGETEVYLVVDSPAALVWAANYGAIELHAWTSCIDDVHRPTYALVDIDPGSRTSFEEVVLLARLYRTALDHLGVRGWPKLTGQRGIQIWVPVEARYTFAETRAWVERLSRAVGATVPELVSWAWEVRSRRGLARLDYTQNAINKTLVTPYSVRPSAGAPVSMPIRWEELDDPDLRPDRWTIADAPDRVAEVGDLFAGVLEHRQSLPDL